MEAKDLTRMNQDLIDFIKKVRKDRDWSQARLAEELGVNQSYVAHVEVGRDSFPLQFFKMLHDDVLIEKERRKLLRLLYRDLSEFMDS